MTAERKWDMIGSAEVIIRAAGEGERRWFYGGGVHTWKCTAEETGGAFALLEDVMTEGKTTPLHRHPDCDEAVYVLEGALRDLALPVGRDPDPPRDVHDRARRRPGRPLARVLER